MTDAADNTIPTQSEGWPAPKRIAAIIEAIRRDFERYRAEFEARDKSRP